MYTCPHCGRVSHNPNDLAHRYCGACHRYADERAVAEAMLTGVVEQSRRIAAIENAEKALGLTEGDDAKLDKAEILDALGRRIWPRIV